MKRPKSTQAVVPYPEVIIFDVDGVLVDVRGSFHRTVLETVKFFTGKRVTRSGLQKWKNRPGFNDDWKLSTAWVKSLGGKQEYDEVKAKFVGLYWGSDGKGIDSRGDGAKRNKGNGNVAREKWLLPAAILRRLAKKSELALFTGRIRMETDYTLDRCKVREHFRYVVTAEDVTHGKPDPEGLLKILNGRDPKKSVYLGDNVDDANAARAAGIPFIGILPPGVSGKRDRKKLLLELGAVAILQDIRQLESLLERNLSAAANKSPRV
jgi:HAD superfamily phosphatase